MLKVSIPSGCGWSVTNLRYVKINATELFTTGEGNGCVFFHSNLVKVPVFGSVYLYMKIVLQVKEQRKGCRHDMKRGLAVDICYIPFAAII